MRQGWMAVGLALALSVPGFAQQDGTGQGGGRGQGRGQGGGGQFAGMQRVGGEVTAIAGATVTLKTEEGATLQVTTTDNTRVMKGRMDAGGGAGGAASGGTIKVSDLKVGDGLIAMGNLDAPNKTMHAAVIMATDAAQVKALKANMGKTYITGKVTAIDLDNAKMTVMRSDNVAQTIGFDETTSFRRGRAGIGIGVGGMGGGGRPPQGGAGASPAESITLADIKVGDNVGGRGALKGGVFVPAELTVATPGQRRARPGAGPGAGAVAGAPDAAPPL